MEKKEKKEMRKENRNIEQKEVRGRLGSFSREERNEKENRIIEERKERGE